MTNIWTGEAPWVHRPTDDAQNSSFLLPPPGTSSVARLDGSAIGDEQQLFEQMSASRAARSRCTREV